jgi:tetratricopeptide (TPR) repeat protein
VLPEWRLLSLEASLRRAERRFAESLKLLDLAQLSVGSDKEAQAVILLNRETVYEQMGDLEAAQAILAEAAPLVETFGSNRLLFALRFKCANNLCHLKRYPEAAATLAQVRDLATKLGNELDLVRVTWLSARISAGEGRSEEAVAGLDQVRREFSTRGLLYDLALSSLDLAVLYLEQGRLGDVKALAQEMAPIFKAKGIAREALASLAIFVDAAQQETATLEIASRVILDLEASRRRAPRADNGSRSHG